MIEYILQIFGQNILQVHYKSGVNRYIYPDAWGCYGSNMSKSQLDFMHNSIAVEMLNCNGRGVSATYIVPYESPLIESIKKRNEFYRGRNNEIF